MSDDDDDGNTVAESSEDDLTLWVDIDKLGNLFSHQGSSFYLRLGAMCM